MHIDESVPELESAAGRVTLVVRLVLLALIFAVPIGMVGAAQFAEANRAIATAQVEDAGLRFGTTALALLDVVETTAPDRPPDAARRATVAALLDRLDGDAIAIGGPAFRDVSSATLRRSWTSFAGAPSVERLGTFGTAIRNAVSLADDAAKLSFEAHALEADLQDILTTQIPATIERLAAASMTAETPASGGRLSVAQQIAIAGELATVDDADMALQNDVDDAVRSDPAGTGTLVALYRVVRGAADNLGAELNGYLGRTAPLPATTRLARERRDLAAHGRALSLVLERQLADLLERRIAADRAERVRIVCFAILEVLASGIALALIGGAAVRRERRALARARQEARALAAELASRRMAQVLVETQAQFRAVFDRSPVGLALLDAAGAIVERNDKFDDLLGRRLEALGRESTELRVERPDGAETWVELDVARLESHDGSAVHAIAIVRDITERRAVDERLRHAATHDAVTGLPNRVAFIERLARELRVPSDARADRMLLFVDLDGFKHVNDTLGHHAGDRLLSAIARRLSSFAGDAGYVARFHGDEFVLLVDAAGEADAALAVAGEVQNAIRAPLSIESKPVVVTSSVGVVMHVAAYERPEDVVRDADVAMYHAKAIGGSSAVIFDEAMDEQRAERARLLAALQLGIDRREFSVAYQPLVDLRTLEPTGFEALLRWEHPAYGSIPPSTFVPLAERSGAIFQLGRFVLRDACRTIARYDRERPGLAPLDMHVNLSVAQLMESGIVADVARTLEDAHVDGSRLVLEITESALLEDGPRAATVLDGLRALGIRLCIDDFGTGYSSLRYLQRFPIDVLKIDRSFVARADGDVASEPIVHMVVTLAHALGMTVIAEGIETERQSAKIRAAGCDLGQGYHYAHPLDGETAVIAWLARSAVSPA